jgi:hypothetical protein
MRGQRFRSTMAPASAPASAPTMALVLQEPLGKTGRNCANVGEAGVARRVAGEGGATPSCVGRSRPGCAQRDRLVGSLPLRPRVGCVHCIGRASITTRASLVAGFKYWTVPAL